MPQRVLGRREPGGGIVAEQGQRTESTLDRAAQAVVDDNEAQARLTRIGDVRLGHRIAQPGRAALGRRNDDPPFIALEEASVGKGL